MLSVAYGKNQSGDQAMHYPEVCYPAQGFEIKSREQGEINLPGRSIPVTKLVAKNSNRVEPITYWVLIGDEVAKSGFLGRLIKLKYAAHGLIPDGLLFRVSSIGSNPEEEWALQKQFVRDLMKALPSESGIKIAGLKE
jgi:EpsI family protein